LNNAGILNFNTIEDNQRREWDSVVAVNQKGRLARMKLQYCDAQAGRRIDREHFIDLRDYRIGGAAAYHGTKVRYAS